ncbi:marine proteobacterial sortase target protein [Sinobacterium norvegicum]|nr:marine proteobacterial sortase target protein [Sinobacterium norvegicum]
MIIVDDYDAIRPRRSNRFLFWLSLAVLTLIGISLALPATASEPYEKKPALEHDISAGHLLLRTEVDQVYRQSPQLSSRVHFDINGMVAAVELTQQFSNPGNEWAEAVYRFPLPAEAAVNYLKVTVGQRVIIGKIDETQKAEASYQQAKKQGQVAALTRQHRSNLFSTSVANIAPGEKISVTIRYLQPVDYRFGRFSLNFPMTLMPRYIPQQTAVLAGRDDKADLSSGWLLAANKVDDAAAVSPSMTTGGSTLINPITITATINSGLPLSKVDSAYHSIVLSRQQQVYSLSLAAAEVEMDRDFELSWQPTMAAAPKAAIFHQEVEQQLYYSLMVLPPLLSGQQLPAQAKETIFVIDTSGSMGGSSIRQAKRSLLLAVDRLKSNDVFNIVEFNSVTKPLFNRSVSADQAAITRAKAWIEKLQAGGGTEMAPALQYALQQPDRDDYLQRVVFITDGAVANEEGLFKLINRELGDKRLFTVAIGSAPNHYFMRRSAEYGRGSFTHIGDVEQLDKKMDDLFHQLESPLLTDISITWPAGFEAESYPAKIPDLYVGQPLLIKTKLVESNAERQSGESPGEVEVRGTLAGQPWRQRLVLGGPSSSAIASLWAEDKIQHLMGQKYRGVDPQWVREQVLAVALGHQLVSDYTSLIAVEQKISRPSDQLLATSDIANLLPQGSTLSVSYPKTATKAQLKMLFGGLLIAVTLFLYCVLFGRQRRAKAMPNVTE